MTFGSVVCPFQGFYRRYGALGAAQWGPLPSDFLSSGHISGQVLLATLGPGGPWRPTLRRRHPAVEAQARLSREMEAVAGVG